MRERGQEGGKGGSKREERRKEQREGGREGGRNQALVLLSLLQGLLIENKYSPG